MSEPRIIKNYPNRRLYDTVQSKYITLSDIRSLVLVRGARHPDFASAFPYGALLRGGEGPVYAWERTPAVGDSARAAFPDRPVWVINGPTVTKRGFEVAERPTSSDSP